MATGGELVDVVSPARTTHRWLARILLLVCALALLGWTLIPAVRGVSLVDNRAGRGAPSLSRAAGLPAREVHFAASDGVALAGWLVMASPDAPTVILVHGFKSNRLSMLPWARYLYAAGYNTLLYDGRGCGESAGWGIGVGASEPADIIGATRYLRALPDLRSKRFAALGVSLGAGDVILAAARDSDLQAVIADSPWADEQPQLARMGSLALGPLTLPLLPYEPALVDRLAGARLEDARPVAVAGQIAPRALLIITSADDGNTTTAPADQQRIVVAAGQPIAHWIAPSGGHAGALYAHPADYQARTLAFLAQYLGAAYTARAAMFMDAAKG
ncbi:MAG TPA: alpha/beta hydrolase [Ktedonobacterales bacterium]|nr:alpha/beta hydrolase [Ktedonobacterales bacterium]